MTTTRTLSLSDQLKRTDGDRKRRYAQNLAFYQGTQWGPPREKMRRRLTINYTRAMIDKLTSYLMGRLQFAVPLGSTEPKRARASEKALLEVYEDNALAQLDFDTEIDCAVLGDAAYRVVWDTEEERVVVTAPDVGGIYAWPLNPLVRAVGIGLQQTLGQLLLTIFYQRRTVGLENLRGLEGPVLFTPNHHMHNDNAPILCAIPVRWTRPCSTCGPPPAWAARGGRRYAAACACRATRQPAISHRFNRAFAACRRHTPPSRSRRARHARAAGRVDRLAAATGPSACPPHRVNIAPTRPRSSCASACRRIGSRLTGAARPSFRTERSSGATTAPPRSRTAFRWALHRDRETCSVTRSSSSRGCRNPIRNCVPEEGHAAKRSPGGRLS